MVRPPSQGPLRSAGCPCSRRSRWGSSSCGCCPGTGAPPSSHARLGVPRPPRWTQPRKWGQSQRASENWGMRPRAPSALPALAFLSERCPSPCPGGWYSGQRPQLHSDCDMSRQPPREVQHCLGKTLLPRDTPQTGALRTGALSPWLEGDSRQVAARLQAGLPESVGARRQLAGCLSRPPVLHQGSVVGGRCRLALGRAVAGRRLRAGRRGLAATHSAPSLPVSGGHGPIWQMSELRVRRLRASLGHVTCQ